MNIEEDPRSYQARQLATLALCHVSTGQAMAQVRAAAWHNILLRLGLKLPLFITHDIGLLLSVPKGAGELSIGGREAILRLLPLSREVRHHLALYRQLLETIKKTELLEKAGTWRLRDELIGAVLARILGDVYKRWPDPAKRVGACDLPLHPGLFSERGAVRTFSAAAPQDMLEFLIFLTSGTQPLAVQTAVEQIDLDTLRLLGMYGPAGGQGSLGLEAQGMHAGALGLEIDLVDLYGVLGTAEVSDVVSFSLDLLPSIWETRRAASAQTFAMDGYASIERRGNLDSLILGDLAYDDELFELKVVENELFYYGHEKQREEERVLKYILLDASPSMRGLRQVFARGLGLTLARKFSLEGDEVWLRFFDARLYDLLRIGRAGADMALPYLLCFRSERGRGYARVFRQLLPEISRLRLEERRQIILYIITHGQCHIPEELVAALAKVASLYGVFILPSTEVRLEYLHHLSRCQIVNEEILSSHKERRERALQIVADTDTLRGAERRVRS